MKLRPGSLVSEVRMMHTAQGEPADERVLKHIQGKVTQLMNVLDGDGDGDITFDEFMRANRKIGQLMYPAFNMQQQLRRRCMTIKFWNAAEKRRKKIQEGMGGASVIDLYRGVLAQEQEHDASYDEVGERERSLSYLRTFPL